MQFSTIPSTSYRRTIGPTGDSQPRREGSSGRLFRLQPPEVANDESSNIVVQQARAQAQAQPVSQDSLEKWMRLMGAARQMAHQEGEQPTMQWQAADMRYRLQRTYFDQERQVTPPEPLAPDQRLQAYLEAGAEDSYPQMVDFVI